MSDTVNLFHILVGSDPMTCNMTVNIFNIYKRIKVSNSISTTVTEKIHSAPLGHT